MLLDDVLKGEAIRQRMNDQPKELRNEKSKLNCFFCKLKFNCLK